MYFTPLHVILCLSLMFLIVLTHAESKRILTKYKARHFICCLERLLETFGFLLNSFILFLSHSSAAFWLKFYYKHIGVESEFSVAVWAIPNTGVSQWLNKATWSYRNNNAVLIRGYTNNYESLQCMPFYALYKPDSV